MNDREKLMSEILEGLDRLEKENNPPMTYGDCMRTMSDEGLAAVLNALLKSVFKVLDMPAAAAHDYTDTLLGFLKQPFTEQEADEDDY